MHTVALASIGVIFIAYKPVHGIIENFRIKNRRKKPNPPEILAIADHWLRAELEKNCSLSRDLRKTSRIGTLIVSELSSDIVIFR